MNKKTFKDDKSFSNLEIGAGCGNFGKLFYPKCYLTDIDIDLSKKCESPQIDWYCDASKLIWSDNRFDKVIMCNPDGYGFRDDEMTEQLLKEILRVLKGAGSQIIIICGKRSRFCNPERVEKRVRKFLENNKSNTLRLDYQTIDSTKEYPNYIFKQTLGDQTFPTSKIIIHVE